jgi:hypothetical protein
LNAQLFIDRKLLIKDVRAGKNAYRKVALQEIKNHTHCKLDATEKK